MASPLDKTISSRFIQNALHLPPGKEIEFHRVTTDSRSIAPKDFFVALQGDRFDGHDFIRQAVQQGATGVLCRADFKTCPEEESALFFRVPDPLTAYRTLAGSWRNQFSIPVICVAGSVGKTTTKEILAALLTGKFSSVLKTEASQNGFIGIPMTLMTLNAHHGAAVVEVGIDDIGAMAQHLDLLKPTASVVTAIGEEHLENLKDLDTVAREEILALSRVGEQGGLVAINADDPWLTKLSQSEHWPNQRSFGLSGEIKGQKNSLHGIFDPKLSRLTVSGPNLYAATFDLPLPGIHNARNFLAALTLANGLGLSETEVRTGLANFKAPYGRSQLITVPSGTRVLCDFYNANPNSMKAAFELVKEIRPPGNRTWACLGDMLELGVRELDFHRELGPIVDSAELTGVTLFGPRMKTLFNELKQRGYRAGLQHFEDMEALIAAFIPLVGPNDFVLIKGSRGMKMERVFQALQGRPSKA